MSHNHSIAEKSEPHARRSGRSGYSSSGNHHRGFNSGGGGGRGSGGGYAHPGQPHSSSVGSSSSQFSSNRSSQKHGNEQGGQYRVNSPNATNTLVGRVVPANSGRAMQNGMHPQPPHVSEASASSGAKPVDMSNLKTLRPNPRPPNPQTSEGIMHKSSQLQFGSLNPNSLMIPARTTSAPPNLNEQVHHGLLKTGSALPIHIGTNQKQEKSQPKKDAIGFNHANVVNSEGPPHAKKESHEPIPVHSDANAHDSSKFSMPFVTLFQQQKNSIQFTSSPQIQSQNCGASQLQNSVNPIVPPPVGPPPQSQQPIYYHNQSHVMQPSGMVHQGNNMTYAQQITGQIPYNMGMGIAPQYSQQSDISSRKNSGVDARAHRDKLELKAERDGSVSYAALERKAELYDKLARGDLPDEEDKEKYCVDFFQKTINHDPSKSPERNETKESLPEEEDDKESDFTNFNARPFGSSAHTSLAVDNDEHKRLVREVHEEASEAREKVSSLKLRRQEEGASRREKLRQAYLRKQLEKFKADNAGKLS